MQLESSKHTHDPPKVVRVDDEAAEAKVFGSAASSDETPEIALDEARKPLSKAYEPHAVEAGRYNWWEENKCFHAPDLAKDDARQTFSMVSFCIICKY